MANVLLVDDEELVRKVVKVVLEAEGHTVAEADSAAAAMERVGDADVIVLDLMMPGEDGISACRRIKAARSDARVLVLTGVQGEQAALDADSAGADDFMVKPFSSLDLIHRIAVLLER